MPADKYKGSEGIDSPSDHLVAVTPDDDTDLSELPKFIFVGTAGDLVVVGADQDPATETVTIKSAANQYHPIRPRRIMETGTTATDIVACY